MSRPLIAVESEMFHRKVIIPMVMFALWGKTR